MHRDLQLKIFITCIAKEKFGGTTNYNLLGSDLKFQNRHLGVFQGNYMSQGNQLRSTNQYGAIQIYDALGGLSQSVTENV
jgi:hypothetical protein